MKLVFSEHISDYGNYIFPYAVWAFPEAGEQPRQLFNAGFLPGSPTLNRFYLCRQVRVDLRRFDLSSENRRILRKGEGVEVTLVPRPKFDYTAQRREFCLRYAEARFGKDTFPGQRLDGLLESPLITHVLVYTDVATGAEVGLALLYCEARALAFYYYAFYDLDYSQRSLGMFMMTVAVNLFHRRRIRHLYLGSCYSRKALYKTQFAGMEFFNGFRWSGDLKELKHLLERDSAGARHHALENQAFRQTFYPGDLSQVFQGSPFRVRLPKT
jgi:hypothetical protein